MKRIIFLLIFIIACFTGLYSTATAGQIVQLDGVGNYANPGGGPRARTIAPAVTAYQEADFVTVNYFRDLGVVTTTIYNEFGEVVYQNETISGYGQVETIYTLDFDPGEYTIVLTNSTGMHMEGNFVL